MTYYIQQAVRLGKHRAVVANTYTYVGKRRTYRGTHTHATLHVGKRQVVAPFAALRPAH